ncbi:hypothetical protein FB567DRAFT_31031 [Paraphoma chrysanthemicola]|uniref:Extracellular membrane protein CFEM domain-containing protein n=1 Tax=Paraphoma chrysanthemicola TaxID=798071 RepID=A0A8K0W519_9PLEO|nr:hypothetical protein FB567DRAFT_31031 [Paraphoma chrysanthemicola]
MRSFLLLLALVVPHFAVGVAAHRDWWMQTLPTCWQNCFASTGDGCGSSTCICQTSQESDSYLPSAVSCAVSRCNAADWALDLVLGQLQLLCTGLSCAIPDDVMEEAYAAASGSDDEGPGPSRTPAVASSTKKSAYKTSTAAPQLTSIIRSTFTRTTTDSSGHTVQVVVPIAVGPSGIVTGSIATSTLSGQAASTRVPSSFLPSSSAQDSLRASSQPSTSTSAAASQRTEAPARGNGSPFENMQATGSKWTCPNPLLGFAALMLLLVMR